MNDYPKASVLAAFAGDAYDDSFYDYGHQHWIAGDVHVIGRRIGRYLCVAIRGTTKDGLDILRDLRFMPWWFRRVGVVPAGFGKGVRALIEETTFLVDIAEDLKNGTLIIVGHSLGAAMALILTGWLIDLGFHIAAVFAFEPARAGFFKLMRLQLRTYVFWTWCGIDIVPRVPFFYRLPMGRNLIGAFFGHPSFFQLLRAVLFGCRTIETALRDHKISVVEDELLKAGL